MYTTQIRGTIRMAFGFSVNFTGDSRRRTALIDPNLPPLNFAQIFGGASLFVLGSTVRIEEIWTLYLQETNPEWIDRDLEYWLPHSYYGNWQAGTEVYADVFDVYAEGFLTQPLTKIRSYSDFTVVLPESSKYYLNGAGSIDNCNFALQEVGFSAPPFYVGQQVLANNQQVFTYNSYDKASPLQDALYPAKMPQIGVYTKAGCHLTRAEYQVAAINTIRAALPEAPAAVCNIYTTSCDAEYNLHLLTNAGYYPTQGAAQIAYELAGAPPNGIVVEVAPFICSDGQTRPVWLFEIILN